MLMERCSFLSLIFYLVLISYPFFNISDYILFYYIASKCWEKWSNYFCSFLNNFKGIRGIESHNSRISDRRVKLRDRGLLPSTNLLSRSALYKQYLKMVPRPFRVQNQEEIELFFYSIYGRPFNYILDEYDNGVLLDYGKQLEFLNKPRLKQSHIKLLLLVLSRCKERDVRDMWREIFSHLRKVYSVDVTFVLASNM